MKFIDKLILYQRTNRLSQQIILFGFIMSGIVLGTFFGCGTTKFSDTSRTATEQLLITSAMEEVIDEFDFSCLTGRKVFVNTFSCATDEKYFASLLRQQLAANGVLLKDSKDEADYILEVAPGVVGTNRYDRMYGVPETKVPAVLSGGTSTTIPEMALIKRTDQKAAVKVSLWAYNKVTGEIIWQSGSKTKMAFIRDRWFLGAGPFTKSSYDKDIQIAGDSVKIPENPFGEYVLNSDKPSVTTEAIYREIDPKSMERLESLRKEGLEELKPKNEDEKKDDSTASDAEKQQNADSAPKNEDPKESDSATVSPSVKPESESLTIPVPANAPVELNQTPVNEEKAEPLPLNPKVCLAVPNSNNILQNSSNLPNCSVLPNSPALSPSTELPVLQFDQLTLPLQSTVSRKQ